MTIDAYAVILAGGKGERFWPLSTAARPKQLLALLGGETLIAMAVRRLQGLFAPEKILVITSRELEEVTRRCVPGLPPGNVIGEPVGRDTAAACALACGLVAARDPRGAFCVLTADHVIGDLPVFQNTLRQSLALASEKEVLITIGIEPGFPSTGFGYIETADPAEDRGGIEFVRARRFVEKPDEAMARRYVEGGRHYWNSGMFAWSVSALRKAFAEHAPTLLPLLERARTAGQAGMREALAAEYPSLATIAVDYALMEKADNIVMARGLFAWDDVGSWPALANHIPPDPAGNHIVGQCESIESGGNVIYSSGRLTALIGVSGLVVVQAEGATLICPRGRAQEVKRMVQLLRGRGRYEDLL